MSALGGILRISFAFIPGFQPVTFICTVTGYTLWPVNGFIIACELWGYIYGTILKQWYVLEFMRPVTFKAIVTGNILSFSHDTSHAIGNVIFFATFGKSFIEVLERYNRKNEVIRIRNTAD